MKIKRNMLIAVVLAGLATGTMNVRADDTNHSAPPAPRDSNPKPYPLKTCVVSGDVIGGDMGKPVTLVYKGQEMKFCCKDCIKDFNKDPDKYLKKLAEEEKKTKQQ